MRSAEKNKITTSALFMQNICSFIQYPGFYVIFQWMLWDEDKGRWHIQSPNSYSNAEIQCMLSLSSHQVINEYFLLSLHLMSWSLNLTIPLLPTSYSPFSFFFLSCYLIHTKGHDILGNTSLLKEMRPVPNVSNEGSCLKFNVVALKIEYREETI